MSINSNELWLLHTDAGYRAHFMDVDFWQPFIQEVCQREGLTNRPQTSAGLPGSYPTFGVDNRWVIKFFGRNFEGDIAFQTEYDANQLVSVMAEFPVPALLGSGQLFPNSDDWPWPYLIFEFVQGISIGEVYEQVSFEDKLAVAQWMGELTRKMHQLRVVNDAMALTVRNAYYNLIRDRHWRCEDIHRRSGILPAHLIDQIEAYLLPRDTLLDPAYLTNCIHADLTADHVLGQLTDQGWTSQHLIDFGDAMVGDFHYDLIALHLDLFRCDKRLLKAYLDAYGLDSAARAALPKRAMSLTLLHRFDVLEGVPERIPNAFEVGTLEELTALIWDVEKT